MCDHAQHFIAVHGALKSRLPDETGYSVVHDRKYAKQINKFQIFQSQASRQQW